MTKNEIDRLLLKYVFKEDIDKPPKWYYENFWLETLLCNSWPGMGLVVEEMNRKGHVLFLEQGSSIGKPGGFLIQFIYWPKEKDYEPQYGTGQAEEAPLAVAIAALRAVGVEIPEEEVPK